MSVPETAVWVYKESNTDELKYSMRSAVKNLGIKRIILVGDKPSWFEESEQAIYIPFTPKRNPNWTRAYVPWTYLEEILKHNVVQGEFLFFNDDFFVLKPITDWVDYARDQEDYNLHVKTGNRVYHMRDFRALRLLRMEDNGVHYNMHIPIKLNTEYLREDIKFWHNSAIKDFAFRTFYGNRHFKDCPRMVDVKYRPNELFLSTHEEWWRANGQEYKDRFPDKTYAERHN